MYIIEEKIYLQLDTCKWCGGHGMPQHNRYPNMCLECGKRYDLYKARRSKRRKGELSQKSLRTHHKMLLEYKAFQDAGFGAPDKLVEELRETEAMLDETM